ncbi:hypothetical protein [Aurantibacillus circumpalustris]|uniref:hypothetical protein n=1 Tax=Aurantibacillus circumpalustris TaxID=3036359 RepID=UPI00295C048C|nr:hypothetical protein [Aurantibacillus circumpalustris]
MNSEERFKKSLEELLSSKQFAFDESNWDKAQQMIDASKKPPRMLLYLLSSVLMLGTISTGVYLFTDTLTTSKETLATKANSKINEPSTAKKIQTHIAPAAAVVIATTESITPSKLPEQAFRVNKTSTIPVKENEVSQVNQSAPAPIGETKQQIEDTKRNTTLDSKVNGIKPVDLATKVIAASQPVASISETSDPRMNDVVVKPYIIGAEKVNPENTSVAKENTETVVKSANPVKIFEGKIVAKEMIEIPVAANTTNSGTVIPDIIDPTVKTQEQNSVNDNSLLANKTSSKQEGIASDEIMEASSNDAGKMDIKDSAKVEVAKAVIIGNTDLISDIPPDTDQGQLGKPKEYPVLFSVEAGASYLFGWQNGGTRDANGFNPVVGINYFNNFSSKMSLTFGLHYSSVGNLSYSNYTSRVTHLGFGEQSDVTVFTPVKIHYLIAPLRFNYHLTPLNTIGLGFNVAYLLNVESEVENYTEKLNSKYNQTLSETSGYTEGFKQYDTQVSLFYKRRFYPNLSLNIELFYGLTDIKDNAFFKSNVFERNNGMKLTLVYNFLKR